MSSATIERPSVSAPTVASCLCALGQCGAFVGSMEAGAYTWSSPRLSGSTIGQHVRHALDHFQAALSAVDGAEIDYDHRERNTPIEADPLAACDAILGLCRRLAGLEGRALDRRVRVRVMLSARGDEAVHESTLGRELAFAGHHAVHHFAMMASIAREQGRPAPEGFGLAPSTLHHEAGASGRGSDPGTPLALAS